MEEFSVALAPAMQLALPTQLLSHGQLCKARSSAGDGLAAAEGGPGSHIHAKTPLLAALRTQTAASVFALVKPHRKTLVLKSSANPQSPCIKTRHLKLPECFCVQTTAFAELPLSRYSVQQVKTRHFPGWL